MEPPVSRAERGVGHPRGDGDAEPPLEPPGTRDSSTGFRTGPNAEFSVDDPMANSSKLVLPIRTASASFRRCRRRWRRTGRRNFPGSCEPQVTRSSFMQRTSLTATTMPARGPALPPASLPSTARARSRARVLKHRKESIEMLPFPDRFQASCHRSQVVLPRERSARAIKCGRESRAMA